MPKIDLTKLTKDLVDKGLLIEAGWQGLRIMAMPKDAPQIQIDEMRMAFFAGAQHLYSSIMSVMDEGTEPTDKDLQRMEQIHNELNRFIIDFSKKFLPTTGNS